MSKVDVIVIGGGHNGLAAAARLADAGRKVVLLERRAVLGGTAAGESFHPGYQTPGVLSDTAALHPDTVAALKLTRHGLRLADKPDALFVPGPGRGLLLSGDVDADAAEVEAFSPGDGAPYRKRQAFLARIAPVVRDLFTNLPDRVQGLGMGELLGLAKKGLAVRRLGKKDMLELLRIVHMCSADRLNEWFASPQLKAALAAPAHHASTTGPWSPGTMLNLLLHDCRRHLPVVGGAPALVAALTAAARAAGAELRTEARVRRIEVAAGAVTGVELIDGELLQAPVVMAACHPVHALFDLVAPQQLPFTIEEDLHHYRSRGTTAVVDLALKSPLRFACRPDVDAPNVRLVGDLNDLERSFDPVKYRQMSDNPLIDVRRLPADQGETASLLVHFAPYDLEGGWTQAAADTLAQRAIDRLARDAPDVAASVVARRVRTPHDLETDFGLTGGHLYHGDHALDQLLIRPTLACTNHHTPISGLYLCSSGTRPGGGLTAAPGLHAANHLLTSR